MAKAILKTNFHFDGPEKASTRARSSDVYDLDDRYLAMVVSDRISAFDVVLPKGIPFKGQVLNQIASKFLRCDGRHLSELEDRLSRPVW